MLSADQDRLASATIVPSENDNVTPMPVTSRQIDELMNDDGKEDTVRQGSDNDMGLL